MPYANLNSAIIQIPSLSAPLTSRQNSSPPPFDPAPTNPTSLASSSIDLLNNAQITCAVPLYKVSKSRRTHGTDNNLWTNVPAIHINMPLSPPPYYVRRHWFSFTAEIPPTFMNHTTGAPQTLASISSLLTLSTSALNIPEKTHCQISTRTKPHPTFQTLSVIQESKQPQFANLKWRHTHPSAITLIQSSHVCVGHGGPHSCKCGV
jgi:hypothetical protein